MHFRQLLDDFFSDPSEVNCENLMYFIRSHGLSIDESEQINNMESNSPYLNILKSISFLYDGRYEASIALLNTLIEMDQEASVLAKVQRAEMLCIGLGEEDGRPNYEQAIALLEVPVAHQNVLAILLRANMYRFGQGENDGMPNYTQAVDMLNPLVEAGDSRARVVCADMLVHGLWEEEGKLNYSRAISLLDSEIESGNSEAMVYRAYLHRSGFGSDEQGVNSGLPDFSEAERLLNEAYDLGNMNACVQLAIMAMEGLNEAYEPNCLRASQILKPAHTQRFSQAFTMQGKILMLGFGNQPTDENYFEAIRYFDNEINRGDLPALIFRAWMHAQGLGGEKNIDAALELLARGVELGSPWAYTQRADIFHLMWRNDESEEHLNLALSDLSRAMLHNYTPAMVQRAHISWEMYLKNQNKLSNNNASRHLKTAILLLTQAKQQNNTIAINFLAEISVLSARNIVSEIDVIAASLDQSIALGNFNALLLKAKLYCFAGQYYDAISVLDTIKPAMLNFSRFLGYFNTLRELENNSHIVFALFQLIHFSPKGRYHTVAFSLAGEVLQTEMDKLHACINQYSLTVVKNALKDFILELTDIAEKEKALECAINQDHPVGAIFWKQRGYFTPDNKSGTLGELSNALDQIRTSREARLAFYRNRTTDPHFELQEKSEENNEEGAIFYESPKP